MDKANIEKIGILRKRAEQAGDRMIAEDIERQFEQEQQKVDPREIITDDIIKGAQLISQFMRKMAKKQTGFWGMRKEEVKLYSYYPEYSHGRCYGIETKMFDIEDDLETFTRSGWVFRLEHIANPDIVVWPDEIPPNPYKILTFLTDLDVARRSISLDEDEIEASELWYTISRQPPDYIDPLWLVSGGRIDRVVSLKASDDREYEESRIEYEKKYQAIVDEALEIERKIRKEYKKEAKSMTKEQRILHEVIEKAKFLSRDTTKNKIAEQIDIKRDVPRTGILSLQHCISIVQTGIKELGI